jgi:hypothetical protein
MIAASKRHDEIHNLVGAGAAEGGMDAAKPCELRIVLVV